MHADPNSADRRARWRARNADKDAAHRAVENFIRRLKRANLPLPTCQMQQTVPHVCKGSIHAMHHDYTRPLDVVWACASWHITDHWENQWRAERASGKALVYINRTIVVEEV
jgi:hypothetical protein